MNKIKLFFVLISLLLLVSCEKNKIVIHYDSNGGENIDSVEVESLENYVFEIPERKVIFLNIG